MKAAMSGLAQPRRVRLLISGDGSARVEHGPLVQQPTPLKLAIATEPVDLHEIWLYHKTTHRELYKNARAHSGQCDDVILWNREQEVTEATTANIVADVQGSAHHAAGAMRVACRDVSR
jgi:para-aminobenzoate synthetase/4-amino-4-deoxychorismate lyase